MKATSRLVLPVFLASLLALAAFPIAPLPQAAAATCSIGTPADFEGSFLRDVFSAQLLFVGTVTHEHTMRTRGTATLYESVVTPHALLKGDVPEEPLVLPHLGRLGADCSGGPRLRAGERVLLPVYWGRSSYDGAPAWQLTGIFSKVLLEDGQAILESALGRHPLGDIETVIRTYGLAVGADEVQIQDAITAALAPAPAATGAGGPDWTGRLVAALAIAAIAGAIAIAIRRSHRDSPPAA